MQRGLLLGRGARRPGIAGAGACGIVPHRSGPPHLYSFRHSGSICHHIVWQPVTCGSQNGCQNAFCQFCITSWLKKCYSQAISQPVCPQCKRIFVSSRIPPILKSVLDSLNLLCPHSSNGCREVLPYSDIGSHIKACPFKSTPFQN
jgi:hypothetical protein